MPNTITVHSIEGILPASNDTQYEIVKMGIVVGDEPESMPKSAKASTSRDLSAARSIPIRKTDTKERISDRINNLLEIADKYDWDGEGAKPVTRELIDIALQIVAELPQTDLPMPHVSVTPLGYVALDWENEPDLLASLVILPGGGIAFSFHSDKTRFHGQDQWGYNIGISRFLRCFVANIKPRRRNV